MLQWLQRMSRRLKRIGQYGYAFARITWSVGALTFCLGSAVFAHAAQVDIRNHPTVLDSAYDFTWTMTRSATSTAPLTLDVETPGRDAGGYYFLTITPHDVCRPPLARSAAITPVTAIVPLSARHTARWTLKCCPDSIAILCHHHRVLTIWETSPAAGTHRMTGLSAGIALSESRYQLTESPYFGNDVMHLEMLERCRTGRIGWLEEMARYRMRFPGMMHMPGSRCFTGCVSNQQRGFTYTSRVHNA